MTEPTGARVFLDANILAKPVTRSLLLYAADATDDSVTWSAFVEQQADRHVRSRQVPVSHVRQAFGGVLSPAGVAKPYSSTQASDRQVLADAAAAGAQFLVTEDVDDFGLEDLVLEGIAAVNPDVYLAETLAPAVYVGVLSRMALSMRNPPRSPEELHVALGREHPRLVSACRSCFASVPLPSTDHEPAVLYRGDRCLQCLQTGQPVVLGLCRSCQAAKRLL